MSSLAVRGLTKSFGPTTVLQPTDLAVDDGEFIVVVGPSGCGKSTLLRLVAGLETPSGGSIVIGGRDVTALGPAERDIAMVFQSYALYPHLTVAENIGFPLRMANCDRREIAAKVGQVAALLELDAVLDRRPRALSGGQRQRVSLGRAIVRDPALLLLDEPLSNLDAGLRVRMRHELARLHQRLGTTMVYVTHDQVEAMTLANRIVVMAHGRVEQVGAPLDLYRRPATIRVAEAIGSPAINLLRCRIVGTDAGSTTVRLPNAAECTVEAVVPAADVGAAATLGVRPENLRPDPKGAFGGKVELFERLGPLSFAHLGEAGTDGTIVAQLPGDRQVTLGDTICFAVEPASAHLFAADGGTYPASQPLMPPSRIASK